MSKLSALINDANAGLSIQEPISDARWEAIAKHCGAPEIAEVKARIAALKEELAGVEIWDGDTHDDIRIAISRFSRLLELTDASDAAQGREASRVTDAPLKLSWWRRWKN